MGYPLVRYFCPNQQCPQRHRLFPTSGLCETCGTRLERLRYCTSCETMGTPAQNRLCYKCKRYLVDIFEVPKLKEYPGPEKGSGPE